MLNLTLVKQTSSAEVSWPIHGWVNQNHNSMMDLSRPPNERSVLQISFRQVTNSTIQLIFFDSIVPATTALRPFYFSEWI